MGGDGNGNYNDDDRGDGDDDDDNNNNCDDDDDDYGDCSSDFPTVSWFAWMSPCASIWHFCTDSRSVRLSIRQPVYLFVFVCLFARLSVCLSPSLSFLSTLSLASC
jgi:hypothetical protein